MPIDNFRRYMSPDFQASSQPALDWMPWENQQQEGQDIGSVLGQLKPQGKPPGAPDGNLPYEGNMLPKGAGGMATGMKTGGKGSL